MARPFITPSKLVWSSSMIVCPICSTTRTWQYYRRRSPLSFDWKVRTKNEWISVECRRTEAEITIYNTISSVHLGHRSNFPTNRSTVWMCYTEDLSWSDWIASISGKRPARYEIRRARWIPAATLCISALCSATTVYRAIIWNHLLFYKVLGHAECPLSPNWWDTFAPDRFRDIQWYHAKPFWSFGPTRNVHIAMDILNCEEKRISI